MPTAPAPVRHEHPSWARAMLALRLLAVDPVGLGGITLRARSGPARDAFLAALKTYPCPARRLGPDIDDAALFGGLDLNATLAAGRMVRQAGLAAHDGPLILPMAERTRLELAARLAAMMDSGARAHPLIALDEAASEEEGAPAALTDRLAFALNLDGLSLADIAPLSATLPGPRPLSLPRLGEDHIHQIAMLAEALGVASPRAACLAMRAASAHAALEGRAEVSDADIEIAATLVLAPRATRLPEMEEETPPEVPEPPETPPESEAEPEAPPDQLPDDILIEAILARLPEDMLARIASGKARQAKGSGSGDKTTGKRRGRPLTPRKGRLGGAARLDLVATLRAAAPWQKARAAQRPDHAGLHIRPSDIHLRRYEERTDRLLIFVVDASGSAAMTRLAEAKGAVELMLAAAYARRDHVALIGFRGTEAEVLLPPTRSLVRTKRELAALPGGGATPLAHGLRAAMELARAARAKGMTPTLALLTDGRANIALNGSPDRARAAEDAAEMGRAIAASGASALVVDMGARPETALEALASAMHAPYFVLPRADARRISEAVRSVMDG
ncbi:magnesium chelatase subunit D [Roseovarius nanhaiticus]|uniref:magnesium chelatase subunit D n=1 Tax=Roseovarius nanhaiticus TaxID=573024 RepID=UPI002491E2A9|nr:magnesium chelatase subunit D [Roseovarius nanhaiticus]